MALPQSLRGIADRSPGSVVPDFDFPGSVLALRNFSFKGGVLQRMVLCLDRESSFPLLQARTFRHGPALENPIHLEAEIIVKSPGKMPLNHEDPAGSGSPSHERPRFRGAGEVALSAILPQGARAGWALSRACLGLRHMPSFSDSVGNENLQVPIRLARPVVLRLHLFDPEWHERCGVV